MDTRKSRGLEGFGDDLDIALDMDEPLGSAFAAALRDDDDADIDMESAEEAFSAALRESPSASQVYRQPLTASLAAAAPAPEVLQPAEIAPPPLPEADFEDDYDEPEPLMAASIEAPAAFAGAAAVASVSSVHDVFDFGYEAEPAGGDRVIPRITIHAFAIRTQLVGMLRQLPKDRRMKNVTMEVHEGGLPGAINHYVNETTPNLLILEAVGDPRQMLAQVDSLAQYCDEGIRVVVLGETNDIRFYRELMNRGVSEYLVLPVQPLQLIRAISALFSDPETPFTGKTLAVTGVKGGVGSSTIAHNLAWALSERIKVSATLVDLDLNFGTTGLDFNQDVGATIADALMSPDRFDDAVMGRLITKATERLSLFTAPATLDRTYDLHPDTYVEVLDRVRSSVPFVVLDLPHIWSDWFKSTIMSADEIVVVAGPDLASLRNGKNLIDFLKAARANDQPPRLVINGVGLPKRPEIPPKDFGQAIGLEPSAVLPFDAHLFGTAANNGQMVFDVAPESKVSQGIDQLAALLSGREVAATKPSVLKKLLGR